MTTPARVRPAIVLVVAAEHVPVVDSEFARYARDYDVLCADEHVEPMAMSGRTSRSWVHVDPDALTDAALAAWVDRGVSAARNAPRR